MDGPQDGRDGTGEVWGVERGRTGDSTGAQTQDHPEWRTLCSTRGTPEVGPEKENLIVILVTLRLSRKRHTSRGTIREVYTKSELESYRDGPSVMTIGVNCQLLSLRVFESFQK